MDRGGTRNNMALPVSLFALNAGTVPEGRESRNTGYQTTPSVEEVTA